MGNAREKYSKAYIMGERNGKRVPFGIPDIDLFRQGSIRPQTKNILKQVDWRGKKVLCVGCGRGEEVKYIKEAGAALVVGVDFSNSACKMAKELLAEWKVNANIICMDILDYVQTPTNEQFNYVVMLDVIEHIPRSELKDVMEYLRPKMTANGIIFLHTPFYPVDNDVIKEGLKPEAMDSSDRYPETKGMHCNRFTKSSLDAFMLSCGLKNISTPTLLAFNKVNKI